MADKPKPKSKPSPRPPLRFGKPEKTNWLSIVLFIVFVVGAATISVWLFEKSPKLRPLSCSNGGMGTLTSFGGCHEE